MRTPRKTSAAAALIIVLVCVVLLTVIVVGFMVTSRKSMNIAAQDASLEESQALSEFALDLAMSQIRDATKSCVTGTNGPSNGNAWASQPGAIRVWNQSGSLQTVYKLYSSGSMQADNLNFLTPTGTATNGDVPADWATLPSQYVDLNTPVSVASSGSTTWVYPIINPIALGSGSANPAIQGFYTTEPVTPAGVTSGSVPGGNASLAMPVTWLYVLQNGALIAPDATSTASAATFNNSSVQPSSTNPIVGRVGFWTDDESCKVNINTAGGTTLLQGNLATVYAGNSDSSWDTPMTCFHQDWDHALCYPVEGEFQRYPGHPATVNLLSVFGSGTIGTVSGTGTASGSNWSLLTGTAQLINLFTLTPRYAWGGSENGMAGSGFYGYLHEVTNSLTGTNAPINRLYASTDELQFANSLSSGSNGTDRTANLLPTTLGSGTFSGTQQMLDACRFFLTAHSRASDLNLFGQPRVAVWPVSALTGTNYRTVYDQLIAFDSTVGTGSNALQYYFQRENPYDQSFDYYGIPRNQTLFAYLENMTNVPIPGYTSGTSTFLNKYDNQNDGQPSWVAATGEWDQILTEIFDYIRTVHLNETWSGAPSGFQSYTVAAAPTTSGQSSTPGEGFVLPISITTPAGNATRGAGRAPTLSEVGLLMLQSACALQSGSLVNIAGTGTNSNLLETAFFFDTFCPMSGYMPYNAPPKSASWTISTPGTTSGFTIGGTSSLTITDGNGHKDPIYVGGTASGTGSYTSGGVIGGIGMGGYEGYPWTLPEPADYVDYPFCRCGGTNAIPLTGTSSGTATPATVVLNSGSLQVSFSVMGTVNQASPGASNQAVTYQTLNMVFPPAIVQTPTVCPTVLITSGTIVGTMPILAAPSTTYDWAVRNADGNETPVAGDVVQSVIERDGDYRMMSYLQNVPSGYFMAHTGYGNQFAHSLMTRSNDSAVGGPEKEYAGGTTATTALTNLGGYVNSLGASGTSSGYYEDNMPDSVDQSVNTWGTSYTSGTITTGTAGNDPTGMPWLATYHPKIDPSITDLIQSGSGSWAGDWENGMSSYSDGPYLNKSDEGDYPPAVDTSSIPYYAAGIWDHDTGFYSPTREMPSAAVFGALPTGVKHTYNAYSGGNYAAGRPWRTLLFCPNPDIASSPTTPTGIVHYGFGSPAPSGTGVIPSGTLVVPPNGFTSPPDRLLLDLFTMPVVEPYAISVPFSTAGRINMNEQIVPFTGITRQTGLYAVLSSQRVPAISGTASALYKNGAEETSNTTITRLPVNIPQTLLQFNNVFAPGGAPQSGDIFHSATDICGLYLVPSVTTLASVQASGSNSWWSGYRLTGDNLRERPYSFTYPLLTTKSNVYTVHIWAQSLKKVPSTPANEFVLGQDQIKSEYRGRATFERYIDPNDSRLNGSGTSAVDSDTSSLEPFYRYRVIEAKQFAP